MNATATRLELPELRVTVDVMMQRIAEGAGSLVAATWTADAARACGDGRDRLCVLRELAERVKRTVTFAPDEYGHENVQSVEETLERRRAGDCDDIAPAIAALGRRAGLRAGLAVFQAYVDDDEGGEPITRAMHVLAVFEDPANPETTIPVECARKGYAVGELPTMGRMGRWAIEWSQPRLPDGVGAIEAALGFGSALLNAGASIFGLKTASDEKLKEAKIASGAQDRQARSNEVLADLSRQAERDAEVLSSQRLAATLAFGQSALKTFLWIAAIGAAASVLSRGGRR